MGVKPRTYVTYMFVFSVLVYKYLISRLTCFLLNIKHLTPSLIFHLIQTILNIKTNFQPFCILLLYLKNLIADLCSRIKEGN